MGSVEYFDFKERKWLPYIPDAKKWTQHFLDIHEGRVRPDQYGRYEVGSGARFRPQPEVTRPEVKFVTPVAQAIKQAKSELKRDKKAVSKSTSSSSFKKKSKKQRVKDQFTK
jgi:hypothetical protein